MVRSMLEPVVTQRASMGRAIRHPWINMYPSPFKEYVGAWLNLKREIEWEGDLKHKDCNCMAQNGIPQVGCRGKVSRK